MANRQEDHSVLYELEKEVTFSKSVMSRQADVSLDPGAVSFTPSEKQSILSSQNAQTITLRRKMLDNVSYVHTALPRINNKVYLTAVIPEVQQLGLLEGNARLFLANRQVGTLHINPETLTDTMRFSLGEDPLVTTQYIPEFQESSKRLFSKKVTQVNVFVLQVTNERKQEINLVLRDKLPVSKNANVTIKLLEISGSDYNNTNGALEWRMTTAEGIVRKKVRYEMTYPIE